MPKEVIQALNIKPDGIYVDGTLGGGGHSELIQKQLTTGKLLGIDRDIEALTAAKKRLPDIVAIHGNFYQIPTILQKQNINKVDGILLDLGVSSYQLDNPERGFSYRFDGPLDMRMNQSHDGLTAEYIVNTYSESELTRILYKYGEERYAPRISRLICEKRKSKPIKTTQELVKIIESALPAKVRHVDKNPAKRTFMALRITVNDELSALKTAFAEIIKTLNPKGRITVITFHSLEDRIIKQSIKELANPCDCPRDIPYCVCQKTPQLRIITRSPLQPGIEELEINNRAHSAKLRVAEKI